MDDDPYRLSSPDRHLDDDPFKVQPLSPEQQRHVDLMRHIAQESQRAPATTLSSKAVPLFCWPMVCRASPPTWTSMASAPAST